MGAMEGFLHLTLFEELESTVGWVLWYSPHWLSWIFPVLIDNRHENILLSLFPVVFIWNPAASFQSSAHSIGILSWSWPPDLSFSYDRGRELDILLLFLTGCLLVFPPLPSSSWYFFYRSWRRRLLRCLQRLSVSNIQRRSKWQTVILESRSGKWNEYSFAYKVSLFKLKIQKHWWDSVHNEGRETGREMRPFYPLRFLIIPG